jgi:hypothetical protein
MWTYGHIDDITTNWGGERLISCNYSLAHSHSFIHSLTHITYYHLHTPQQELDPLPYSTMILQNSRTCTPPKWALCDNNTSSLPTDTLPHYLTTSLRHYYSSYLTTSLPHSATSHYVYMHILQLQHKAYIRENAMLTWHTVALRHAWVNEWWSDGVANGLINKAHRITDKILQMKKKMKSTPDSPKGRWGMSGIKWQYMSCTVLYCSHICYDCTVE